ncbi:propionate catabolism operon regulatory protein PrpR [Spiribacter sp. SSL99]|uniref:propionate catabolism operon regulatory protein PrpR n=1 Tax=Spiribacter sp. SSL99 TaxID=1866884 RepID=UPI00132FAE5C|nr:propionate catabolism operon regulatory protein PrpR [Spiribacter sp. SSL99]
MADQSVRGEDRPVILAVGFSRLKEVFRVIVPSYAAQADVHIVDRGFDDALAEIRRYQQTRGVDAVVAAGSNGAFLRRHLALPVILVTLTGFDVLNALATARRSARRIALISHGTTHPELIEFKQHFGLELEHYAYETAADAERRVSALASRGVGAIIGPGLVTDLAEQAGLAGIFVYSRASVEQALDGAIEISRIGRIEAARRERLDTILQQLEEGVVAVDMDERVQSFNPAMARLLGVDADAVEGRRLSQVASQLALHDTLAHGVTELGGVQRIGNRTVVTNRIPIREQGVQTGAVVTVQDSATIQRVDRSLRSTNKPRQFAARYELDGIIGDSQPLREARTLAAQYAATDTTVLILGESGTGKELLAQGIHNASARRGHAFVALNCGAFPESLLESELFGFEEGAFTGSRRGGKPGLFESAHTGTIFLDEIGEMPLTLQTRLLRVLQEHEVIRLGATQPTPVDVRVIAATHRDLAAAVAEGAFRQDLYYRINILRLDVPPLRERLDDLPALARSIAGRALARQGRTGAMPAMLEQVMPYCRAYHWPGNIRELENLIERLAIFAPGFESGPMDQQRLERLVPELFSDATPPRPAVDDIDAIHRVLAQCGGNRSAACRQLGISRSTLWRRLSGAS